MSGTAFRTVLAITGAVAGCAYWLLLDEDVLINLPAIVQRFVVYFAVVFFPAFGLMAGPLSARGAALRGAALAALAGALVSWAGMRFALPAGQTVDVLEPTGKGLIAAPVIILAALAVPVLIAAAVAPGGWRAFSRVVPAAWTAAVKALIALLFVGLFWIVYFLSHALLELAGIGILEDIAREDPSMWIISGTVLGLALAVTNELERTVHTLLALVLRLLRLLLVPVSLVMAVFVIAALLQGLEQVFDNRSAAATMMAMAAGAMALLISALDAEDEATATVRPMVWSMRALGVVLPVVAVIAAYALWIRIAEYGWTPPRLAAVISAVVVVLFTIPVAANTPLALPGWRRRTRTGLVWALLGSLALGVIWFTPLLNAQRISAASQLDRLIDGRGDPEEFDFWPLAQEWGIAGREALATYRARDLPVAVQERITLFTEATDAWDARSAAHEVAQRDGWARMRAATEVLPEGSPPLPDADDFGPYQLGGLASGYWADRCDGADTDAAPRCVALAGDFLTDTPEPEFLIILQERPGAQLQLALIGRAADGTWRTYSVHNRDRILGDRDVLAEIRAGDYVWTEPRIRGVGIGPTRIVPQQEGE